MQNGKRVATDPGGASCECLFKFCISVVRPNLRTVIEDQPTAFY